MKFRVLRPHDGDKFYEAGEIREAKMGEVKHLIPNVLKPIDDDADQVSEVKAIEPAPVNKAEKKATENKSAS